MTDVETLAEALTDARAMGDSLAECVGLLTATITEGGTLTDSGVAGARDAVLAWFRASGELGELLADADRYLNG